LPLAELSGRPRQGVEGARAERAGVHDLAADRFDLDAALVGLARGQRTVVDRDHVAIVGTMIAIVQIEQPRLEAGKETRTVLLHQREPAEVDTHVAPGADLEASRRGQNVEPRQQPGRVLERDATAVEASPDVREVEGSDETLGDPILPKPLEARLFRNRLEAVLVAETAALRGDLDVTVHGLALQPALPEPAAFLEITLGVGAIGPADARRILRHVVEDRVLVLEKAREPAPLRVQPELGAIAEVAVVAVGGGAAGVEPIGEFAAQAVAEAEREHRGVGSGNGERRRVGKRGGRALDGERTRGEDREEEDAHGGDRASGVSGPRR